MINNYQIQSYNPSNSRNDIIYHWISVNYISKNVQKPSKMINNHRISVSKILQIAEMISIITEFQSITSPKRSKTIKNDQ